MTGILSNIANMFNLSGDQQAMPAGFIGPQQPPVQGPPTPTIMEQISSGYSKNWNPDNIGPQFQGISKDPGFNQALFKLGSTLLAARQKGMGLGEGLIAGQEAFNTEIDRAKAALAQQAAAKHQGFQDLLLQAQAVKALQPETSPLQKNFAAMGIDTNTPQGRALMMRAILKPESQVNVNNGVEPQFNKAYGEVSGKAFAETAQKIAEAGRQAPINIDQNKQLDALLSQIQTGTGAQTGVEIKKTVKGIGLNPEDLGLTDNTGAADAAAALSGKLALELRNPAGGAGMPGAMSDQDRAFLQSMTPNIAMTPEGRKLAVNWNNKIQDRNVEVAQLAREYKKANKGILDDGFDAVLTKYSAARPLFDQADVTKLQKITQPTNNISTAVTSGGLTHKGGNVYVWSPQ